MENCQPSNTVLESVVPVHNTGAESTSTSTIVHDLQDASAAFSEQNLSSSHPMPVLSPRSPAASASAINPSLTENLGRPQRQRRLPARYRDCLPEPAPAILSPIEPQATTETQPLLPRIRLVVRDSMQTMVNAFGLWRQYLHRPTFDPDNMVPSTDLRLANTTGRLETQSPVEVTTTTSKKNATVDLLLQWQNTGSELKSNGELNRLADVLRHPDFSVKDLGEFDATRENRLRDKEDEKSPVLMGFQESL